MRPPVFDVYHAACEPANQSSDGEPYNEIEQVQLLSPFNTASFPEPTQPGRLTYKVVRLVTVVWLVPAGVWVVVDWLTATGTCCGV